MCQDIFERFHLPNDGESVVITSKATIDYNSFAWVVDDDGRCWEPAPMGSYYWPQGIPRASDLISIVQMYNALGFDEIPYNSPSSRTYEPRHEKLAIYVDGDAMVTHVARQISDDHIRTNANDLHHRGKWKSKLAKYEDIVHELDALEGGRFGYVEKVMRRTSIG
jgi:hypothetical protein